MYEEEFVSLQAKLMKALLEEPKKREELSHDIATAIVEIEKMRKEKENK